MRQVSFPFVRSGTTIVYPDDISLFDKTEVVGNMIHADYYGTNLTILDRMPIAIPIRVITLRAFIRRMSSAERTNLRDSNNELIKEIREDLERSDIVNMDDSYLVQQLIDVGLSQSRRDVLLADGTEDEQP